MKSKGTAPPPKVFISYSHDSDEHADRVLALADRLRQQGVDCLIDQYVPAPPEGWTRWMAREIKHADFVLLVCTPTYYHRVMGREKPGKGKGVKWEGNLIYQAIYDADTVNEKFVPVLFKGAAEEDIPDPLRPFTHYRVDTEDGYDHLYRRLTDQHDTPMPPLGHRVKLPPRPRVPREDAAPAGPGQLWNVPEPPPHFLDRPADSERLKRLVLSSDIEKIAVTGWARRVGVQGMGGIGKTVLAAAVARDEEVRRAFPDGVLWITLGQTPVVTTRQAELAEALGRAGMAFEDAERGRAFLTRLAAEKACLIILDDVWKADQAAAFGAPGPRARVLITTRDAGIIAAFVARGYEIDRLNEDQAMELLARWSGQAVASLPGPAREVAAECGRLPLALAMIGATVRGRAERWDNTLQKLRGADLAAIRRKFPDYPYPDLLRAIEVSVEAIEDPQNGEGYSDFAVFGEDTPVPECVVQTLWEPLGLGGYQAQDRLDLFVERSLLRRDDRGRLTLHDLQYDYVRAHAADLPGLHKRLLAGYRSKCPSGWPTGPDDGYFFQQLCGHLARAGEAEELRTLLLDFDWLAAKLEATDPAELVADFDFAEEDEALERLQGAVCLSAHVLAGDPRQLSSQLRGRLLEDDDGDVQALLARTAGRTKGPRLDPLTGSLIPPGGPLIRILTGHNSSVTSVAVYDHGKRAVSASNDKTLKVWDLESGRELKSLKGHSDWVRAVAVTPDGKRAVSESDDKTLKVWDLESGAVIAAFTADGAIHCVAVAPDGRTIVAGDALGAVHFLRLEEDDQSKR